MKVTVSAAGRFWAFRLAEQLERRGLLHRLVTTHPPLHGEQIDRRRVVTNPLPEALMRAPRKVGLSWHVGDYLKAVAFDRWAARHAQGGDLLVGFASFCLLSMRAARASGAQTVLERGSTHVLTQYELVAEEYRRWGYDASRADRRLLDRQLREYDEADYICVPSTFVLRSFLERGFSPERLLHVPFGVDLGLFSPGHHSGSPFRVLTVGLSLRKGTPYLLEAVAGLEIPDLEVWLVGAVPPDLRPLLHRTTASFRHLGVLSHAELANVYRNASVFALPSVEEGLALVILEAMASGLPVIATPNTGAEDLMTSGIQGFVVPPRDADALRRALCELYRDEARRRAMGAAAAQAAQAWTWDAYGERVVRAYTRVLGLQARVGSTG